ncbi:MAG: hypothetical protein AAGG50_00340 [Bacteroidota bacterium]
MAFAFSAADFDTIAEALGVPVQRDGTLVRYELTHAASGRTLALEITPEVGLPDSGDGVPATLALVSVYATNSFLQLQGCTGFVASEELGEVIFFAKSGPGDGRGATSGLVVEREAGSSLYANVTDRLLSADFTQLPPEVMMSAVALSLSESLFDEESGFGKG